MNEKTKKYGAIILCLVIGYLATVSTDLQSSAFGRVVMGGPMVALLVSMIACNIIPKLDKDFKAGTTFASKKFLNWGIILTGATLSFADILGTGVKALPLIIFNILLAFTVALLVGKKIGVTSNTATLVGGGTCICGGTAIATLSRIIKALEDEIAFAMAAIFLFDTISAFTYPYIAGALHLTDNQFAFVAGTAINDTSSVAGAQATFVAMNGLADWSGALNVKLVRTTMLIFVALAWTIIMANRAKKNGEVGSGDSMLQVKEDIPDVHPLVRSNGRTEYIRCVRLHTVRNNNMCFSSRKSIEVPVRFCSCRRRIQDQVLRSILQGCETDPSRRNHMGMCGSFVIRVYFPVCKLCRIGDSL